ncbi:MAG: glycerol-3-phosphate acyltransferase [Caldilineaceae bacterium]|nr:glycerol-3-phosphate acyltransferase [Caldilineaceae bacterium]
MIWLLVPLAIVVGYLLGATPVGLLVGRLYGVDVRGVGSGRTGTTNVWRAAGLKAAIPTLIGDAVKGAVAIWLIRLCYSLFFPEPDTMAVDEATTRLLALHLAEAWAGGAAIIGRNWSIFMGFKGGARGITSAATTMMLSPLVGGMVWLIGAFAIWWTRMASLATFAVGASTFAIFLMLAVVEDWATNWPYIIYGVITLVSVVVALRPNREKLKEGKERVVSLW